jgi:hypothetical protein
MKYIIKHKIGDIQLYISQSNSLKHKIHNGILISRQCGDCKLYLEFNDFDSRVLKGERKIHSKCRQCHKIRKLLKNSLKEFGKDSSTEQILGISYYEFIMWLNQGDLKHTDIGLHIDHCVPQSLGQNREDMKILNHYSNLQLMKSKENLSKGNKYIYKNQLEKVLLYSPNSQRLLEIIRYSKIAIIE